MKLKKIAKTISFYNLFYFFFFFKNYKYCYLYLGLLQISIIFHKNFAIVVLPSIIALCLLLLLLIFFKAKLLFMVFGMPYYSTLKHIYQHYILHTVHFNLNYNSALIIIQKFNPVLCVQSPKQDYDAFRSPMLILRMWLLLHNWILNENAAFIERKVNCFRKMQFCIQLNNMINNLRHSSNEHAK